MNVPTRSQLVDIETLRGIAVILMVMGHVIGYTSDSGLRVSDGSALRHFYDTLSPFRMPLFTVIAGYVYALRPLHTGQLGSYLGGRLRRLVPPLICGTALFLGIRSLVPAANSYQASISFVECVVRPQGHFWFLYMMIWISVLIVPLEQIELLSQPRRLGSLIVVFAGMSLMSVAPPELALSNTVRFLPYFLFGVGLRRFWDHSLSRQCAKIWLIAGTAVLMTLYQSNRLHYVSVPAAVQATVIYALGFASVALAFSIRTPIPVLARVGAYSYGIYLLHVHATAGLRILLRHIGIESILFLFLAGSVAGVVAPIIAESLTDRFPAIRLLMFGRIKPIASRAAARETPSSPGVASCSPAGSRADGAPPFVAYRPETFHDRQPATREESGGG